MNRSNAAIRVPLVNPQSVEELAASLGEASARGQSVVPWGAGTLQHLGRAPLPDARRLATGALSRVLEYNPADLTITVEAGVTLAAIQAALRPHGQWLPWEPPAPARATIGGLLAAGLSGPLRLGYGTPRDWVLGMRVALGDGRLVKSGGKVVKNVAGYDTHKLHIGALGTLGVIAEATLKVAPLPERVAALIFACRSAADGFALAEQLRQRPLAPISIAIGDGPDERWPLGPALVAVRFAGVPAAVERQIDAAAAAARQLGAASATVQELSADEHQLFWQSLASFAHPTRADRSDGAAGALIIRAGAAVAALPSLADALARHAPPQISARVVAEGGVGLAYARWELADAGADALVGAVAALRAAVAALGGYALVEAMPAELEPLLDRWGPPPANLALMRALKAQWDPRAALNRGRYAGGI